MVPFTGRIGSCMRALEYHGPHEVDWTLTTTPSFMPSVPIPLRMRTHILLELVFRIYEEWNGNKQLNEKSTFGPLGPEAQEVQRVPRQFNHRERQKLVIS